MHGCRYSEMFCFIRPRIVCFLFCCCFPSEMYFWHFVHFINMIPLLSPDIPFGCSSAFDTQFHFIRLIVFLKLELFSAYFTPEMGFIQDFFAMCSGVWTQSNYFSFHKPLLVVVVHEKMENWHSLNEPMKLFSYFLLSNTKFYYWILMLLRSALSYLECLWRPVCFPLLQQFALIPESACIIQCKSDQAYLWMKMSLWKS